MKKRMFVLFAAVLMSAAAFSQGFGVRAGFNMVNINGEVGGEDLETALKPSFNAGLFYEINVASDFYFQPNLLFSMKGAQDEDDSKLKYNVGYIELPLHFLYKPQLGSGSIIVGFGPYLAYGVTGKIKYEDEDMDIKFKNDLGEEDAIELMEGEAFFLKPFDAGADVFFGYEFPFKLSVQFNAQLGLLNLFPKVDGEELDDTSIKNINFGLSLGYRF